MVRHIIGELQCHVHALSFVVVVQFLGCMPADSMLSREDPIAWRMPSEIVMLATTSGVENSHSEGLRHDSVRVTIALSRPDKARKYNACDLAVYVSVLADSGLVVDLRKRNVFLVTEGNLTSLVPTKESSSSSWRGALSGADAILCFDLDVLDSTQLHTVPLTIHLGDLVMIDGQTFGLGQLKLASFESDTAKFIY